MSTSPVPALADYTPRHDLLRDRVILVTGAGQGIGRVASLTFAKHGAQLILHGRKAPKLEKVYDEIIATGAPEPAILPLDLEKSGDAEFKSLAETIYAEFGRLDGLLHNAAHFTHLRPLANETLGDWLRLLRVNLAAPFALTRACLPLLKRAADASVILTSASHGAKPAAYGGGFAVSKNALHALLAIQAQEWELLPNLRINALVPGPVRSPQRARTHPGEAQSALPAPEQLMRCYLYLMGPDSRGVSGKNISCSSVT
ncbi:MAG: SDR family NAD(P)-dependent oxidoreductase [Burkholderiales bacterium]|nr:SDR family NAD(P)-dependent oxidoreductase [Burkholderiales bacterium]